MAKIWLIIKREYLTRVKTKAFLLSTFLVPLSFALIIVLPILITLISDKEYLRIYVIDRSGMVIQKLINDEAFTFIPSEENYDSLKTRLIDKHKEGILVIPEDLSPRIIEINYLSSDKLSLDQETRLRGTLRSILREIKIEQTGISKSILEKLKVDLSFSAGKIGSDGKEKKASSMIGAALGYIMAFLIYMTMFIYGSFVMRGVVEEKVNRLVEIIISSVKPVELMLGKIIGIGAMGLTQLAIWFIMKTIILLTAITFFSWNSISQSPNGLEKVSDLQNNSGITAEQIQEILLEFHHSFNLNLIFFFFFYFIGGYLLYGSLFAAIGSAVDQESDAHQLSFPVTIPLIIPMLILVKILQNPNGAIAKFASIFPLFSPMTMLVRLSSVDVPWYELVLSMVLLIMSFLFSVWISARIYRIGILMYGKKPSFKELAKWAFYKN